MYLCDIVKVVHPIDLALIFSSGDHLALDIFVIGDGEALAHGAGSHELGAMRVVQGILQDSKHIRPGDLQKQSLEVYLLGFNIGQVPARHKKHDAIPAFCGKKPESGTGTSLLHSSCLPLINAHREARTTYSLVVRIHCKSPIPGKHLQLQPKGAKCLPLISHAEWKLQIRVAFILENAFTIKHECTLDL